MALVKRNNRGDKSVPDKESQSGANHANLISPRAKSKGYITIVSTSLVTLAVITGLLVYQGTYSVQGDVGRGPTLIGDGYKVNVHFNARKVESSAKMDGQKLVSLGPHRVSVHTKCPKKSSSTIFLQVSGDALVNVPLEMSAPDRWEGSFRVPISGHYTLKPVSFGCGDESTKPVDTSKEGITFHAIGKVAPEKDALFVEGAWIKSSLVKKKKEDTLHSKYTWVNPRILDKEVTLLNGSESSQVVKEGVVQNEKSYQQVSDLDNYELVCWIGSKSAEESWGAFKHLRPQIFPHQRPFKFHYDVITNYVEPDKDWVENAKEIFRKCKQILVSIDEPDKQLSQLEYRDQLTVFIKHLLNAFKDDTFPIWIFTTAEDATNTKNCHSPFLKRTTDHPCNAVLKDMFQKSPFPERVQLLDNTDFTFNYEQHEDIVSIIAMRIFVMIGKQVTAWREAKQRGDINGLYRDGVLEPNFELVPYDWNSKLDNE